MSAVTPLTDLSQRLPIVGKLRSGKYAGGRPQAINTWRLTTSSRPFAEQFAARYGGTVEQMSNPNSPHQWEVTSDTDEVAIALIDDGYSVAYELWSSGGCQRRCDGVTVEALQTTGPDNVEYTPSPCICDRKGVLECSLKSRLTLLLPDLPFAGGVVYETGSKNFAEESQGMLRLIQQMQSHGVTRGVLRLEQRKSSGGRRYTIAVVGVTESPEAIASGMAGMRSLGRADDQQLASVESPAIEAGEPDAPPSSGSPSSSPPAGEGEAPAGGEPPSDEDVVDAEIVDEGPESSEPTSDGGGGETLRLDPADRSRYRAAFMARVKGLGLDYDEQVRPFLSAKYGVEGGWSELSDSQAYGLYRALIVPDGDRYQKDDAERRFKAAVQEYAEVSA